MANTEVVVDRMTVKEYCEEYCRDNVRRQCQGLIREHENEERKEFEKTVNEVCLCLKGLMLGFGAYWLYSKRHWFS